MILSIITFVLESLQQACCINGLPSAYLDSQNHHYHRQCYKFGQRFRVVCDHVMLTFDRNRFFLNNCYPFPQSLSSFFPEPSAPPTPPLLRN